MKLQPKHFIKMMKGDKIIESRLYDEKRRQINVGDKILFICSDEPKKKILTKIKALYRYQSFSDLFFDFPLKYFGGKSKLDLLKEVEVFYSKKDQKKYGVIGIKIELQQK